MFINDYYIYFDYDLIFLIELYSIISGGKFLLFMAVIDFIIYYDLMIKPI